MPRKIKIARAVVLARKRVFRLCYTLHYFHLNQITSLQHLIHVQFMREAQSVEDPINITQYRRHIFETISGKCLSNVTSNYLKSKYQNCIVLRKLLLLLLLLSSFLLLLLFSLQLVLQLSSLLLDTVIIGIVIYYIIVKLFKQIYQYIRDISSQFFSQTFFF